MSLPTDKYLLYLRKKDSKNSKLHLYIATSVIIAQDNDIIKVKNCSMSPKDDEILAKVICENQKYYSLQNEVEEMELDEVNIKKLLNKIWYVLPNKNEENSYYLHINDIIKFHKTMFVVKEIHLAHKAKNSSQNNSIYDINSLNKNSYLNLQVL